MLDPWIIEEIIRKEEEQRREQERSRIEAPLERPARRPPVMPAPAQDEERGVIVIDI